MTEWESSIFESKYEDVLQGKRLGQAKSTWQTRKYGKCRKMSKKGSKRNNDQPTIDLTFQNGVDDH